MIEIYEKYPLTVKAINFINISNNESNHLPYHGIDHLFEVMRFAFITFENDPLCKESNINKLELLIAALFHDYGHSGGKTTDDINIGNAINGVSLFHSANPEFDLNEVINLIKATEYPYTVPESELTLSSKVLRDSDMCYLFYDVSMVKLYSGLRTEFGTNYSTFLTNQVAFINGMTFYTERNSKQWINVYKTLRLKELSYLTNAL